MQNNELKLFLDNEILRIPPWIKFALSLGAFLIDEGVKNGEKANVVVTLPIEEYFSLFAAVGIADRVFSTKKEVDSIHEKLKSLNVGSRLIFVNNGKRKKVSVVRIEESNVSPGQLLLYIRNGTLEHGIPENQWLEKFILLGEESAEIKRSIRVRSSQKTGVNIDFLKHLYSQEMLNQTDFYPGEYYYLIGNKNKILNRLGEAIFIINGTRGTFKDFLYISSYSNNSYSNGKIFSDRSKKIKQTIDSSKPVIYDNISGFLKQSNKFNQNPSLIIVSRSDHDQRIDQLESTLTRKIVQNDIQFISKDILKYIDQYGAQVPSGIELVGWRERYAK